MARKFLTASSQRGYWQGAGVGTAPVINYPFTLFCWFNLATIPAANNTIFLLGTHFDFSDNIGFQIVVSGGNGQLNGFVSDSASSFQAWQVPVNLSTNTWYNAAFVGASSTNRTGYLNGGNATADTASCVFGGNADTVSIGYYGADLLTGAGPDVTMAEIFVWNVALTAGEISGLASGVHPSRVRSSAIVGSWPYWGLASPEPDLSGFGRNNTLTNSPALAPHAPTTLWTPRRAFLFQPNAALPGFNPWPQWAPIFAQ